MSVSFNSNIKLLMGGSFCGCSNWDKSANDIDKCFKLYYIKEGKAQVQGRNYSFDMEGPNLYFINGYAIKSQHCITKMCVDWIHFHPESVYFNYILRYGPCVQKLRLDAFESFEELFPKFDAFFMKHFSDSEERVVKLKIQSLIQMTIAHVFADLDQKQFDDNNTFLRLLPALEYINENYDQDVNLAKIAEVCFLSPNYFHRLFTKVFKVSPAKYIHQMRMEESLRQLIYTSKAVKEIAYAVGYEDEAYFSRTFSKTYHISPGRYRKENKNKLP